MANYAAQIAQVDNIQTVRLTDSAHQAEAAIAVGVGNVAYEWKCGGDNLLYFPYPGPGAFRQRPNLCGVPLLAPWANRLEEDGFWANGVHYQLNAQLGNLRRDGHNKPIHGLISFTPLWELVETGGDDASAWSRSRLQFFRYPELMAQFPFAHTLTMTHRLHEGALSVETAIENHSASPMPIVIGFHPYFHPPGMRDDWKVHLPVTEHWKLSDVLIPTGEFDSIEPVDAELRGRQFDDVYGGLKRDTDGFARCQVETGGRRLTVSYGPTYTTAVAYAPPGRDFICFEPMAAVTNALNLAHAGKYQGLQSAAPGGTWRGEFRMEFR